MHANDKSGDGGAYERLLLLRVSIGSTVAVVVLLCTFLYFDLTPARNASTNLINAMSKKKTVQIHKWAVNCEPRL